jgi:hypothetical protein
MQSGKTKMEILGNVFQQILCIISQLHLIKKCNGDIIYGIKEHANKQTRFDENIYLEAIQSDQMATLVFC